MWVGVRVGGGVLVLVNEELNVIEVLLVTVDERASCEMV